eukprot:4635998-Karenia_brevis.AAC.1
MKPVPLRPTSAEIFPAVTDLVRNPSGWNRFGLKSVRPLSIWAEIRPAATDLGRNPSGRDRFRPTSVRPRPIWVEIRP